jgi:Pyruvate/2-oxoacid:ferredoxin oxidoreductase gamma subunit
MPARQIAVPAKQLAIERLGNELFSNTIMLGSAAQISQILDRDTVLRALLDIIPRFEAENRQAFEIGLSVESPTRM